MSIIFYNHPELVIAYKKQIHFIYPHDLQIFKTVDIPDDLIKRDSTTNQNRNDQNDDNGIMESPYIQNVALSLNREFLAVTTSGQKALLIYKCYPVATKLLSIRQLARASSSLAFSKNAERLLLTDKTGDCYEYNCLHDEAPPRLLLGHLSIVYKVLWSPDEQHIITCDRDDKIRITNYPDTYDIHAYCLGHKEFVADLAVLPNETNILLSVSGDSTLQLWNYKSGQSLTQCELPAPGFKLALRSVNNDIYEVAVLLYQHDQCTAIYNMHKEQHAAGEIVWIIKENRLLTFPGLQPSDLCFVNASLYVVGFQDKHFKLCIEESEIEKIPINWLEMVHEQFKNVMDGKMEDVSSWFKKHYDNVSDYLERKKRRIEEKNTNKK